ncbi:complement C3-like [Bombina bombina]|uniref:complement C3-like n=1 Tax=Bombina bombina TaxID=8345 RepID=UPI00235AC1A3|nr:complement C3-like [Bombina bombina]
MPATMSLIEVTMLTGFYPNKDDLKQLTDSTENYIWKFEANLAINSSSVVIYLHEVSNKKETVIGFRVHKEFDVGMLQPADVTIYEYYDQDKKCSTFYNLPDESDQLMKLCKGSLCKCAVEKCCTQEKISSTITSDYLYNKACKQEGIYDVFKVILKQTDRQASFDSHTLEVLQFFKKEDENDHGIEKHFISHTACRESLKLEVNKKYLIMSYSSDLWPLSTETVYAFSSKTFVMTWPEENEGQDKVVEALTGFSKRMENGCDT